MTRTLIKSFSKFNAKRYEVEILKIKGQRLTTSLMFLTKAAAYSYAEAMSNKGYIVNVYKLEQD